MIVAVVKKLYHFISLLLSPFKRIFCWFKRRRKLSGTILPLATHYPPPSDSAVQQSVPGNDADIQLEPWDNWGVTDTSNHVTRSHLNAGATYQRAPQNSQDDSQPDVNYFEDMQPSIKKSKKIIVRKTSGHNIAESKSTISSRLAASSVAPVQGSELTEWEDSENAWDDGVINEDLTHEADLAIKEKRRQEREQRQLDNARRKHEKQNSRTRGDSFTAVKLS